jgi:hypothetical protein
MQAPAVLGHDQTPPAAGQVQPFCGRVEVVMPDVLGPQFFVQVIAAVHAVPSVGDVGFGAAQAVPVPVEPPWLPVAPPWLPVAPPWLPVSPPWLPVVPPWLVPVVPPWLVPVVPPWLVPVVPPWLVPVAPPWLDPPAPPLLLELLQPYWTSPIATIALKPAITNELRII